MDQYLRFIKIDCYIYSTDLARGFYNYLWGIVDMWTVYSGSDLDAVEAHISQNAQNIFEKDQVNKFDDFI
ncbi:hypothetical protein BpHYR1_031290 [Brachionus plicatilis]|uniref:Uncharacterized protein n=1 Tax=Brachionus plicatilis TaxID=10195 RepID=A0A3M7RQR4_BRAPC|nr:hypothetical protein BpHYR1_031290 [Brachionus plicatilis]